MTERIVLTSDTGEDIAFDLLARLTRAGRQYVVLQEVPEEGAETDEEDVFVSIYEVTPAEDGGESLRFVEDEDESDEVFYLWQAENEDYEFCDAE